MPRLWRRCGGIGWRKRPLDETLVAEVRGGVRRWTGHLPLRPARGGRFHRFAEARGQV